MGLEKKMALHLTLGTSSRQAHRRPLAWAVLLLVGSFALPFFVLLELNWGLLAGGIADMGGLLVIVALLAMLVGIWRYTGKLDAASERTAA